MGKLLRLKDYILISACLASEIYEEIRLAGGMLPSAMENRYGFVPSKYKKKSYLTEVSEMLSVGDIERKIDEKGRVYLILTSSGNKKFKRKFRLFFNSQEWDGYFMVAAFDIPEKERKVRDRIRAKLIELGFGMLQESVWISPYHFEEDLREFIETQNLGRNVFVLTAKKVLAGDIKPLAERIWRLREINKSYMKVITKIKKSVNSKPKRKEKLIQKASEIYLETFSNDPLLPKELLPNYWAREKALRLLNDNIK